MSDSEAVFILVSTDNIFWTGYYRHRLGIHGNMLAKVTWLFVQPTSQASHLDVPLPVC